MSPWNEPHDWRDVDGDEPEAGWGWQLTYLVIAIAVSLQLVWGVAAVTDFTAEVEATERDAQRDAVDSIKPIHDLRKLIAEYNKALKAFDPDASDYGKMSALRRWLLDHEGEVLDDTESGLTAWFASGGEQTIYDSAQAIKDRHPDLFVRLGELGAFEVDGDRIKDAVKKGLLAQADADRIGHRVSRTPRLMIDRIKED